MNRFVFALGELLKIDKQIKPCYVNSFVHRLTYHTMGEFASHDDFLALLWICLQSLCTNTNVNPDDWEKLLVCSIIWVDKMHIEMGRTVWELLPWYYSDKQIERFDTQSLTYIRFFPGLVTSECLRDVKQHMHYFELSKEISTEARDVVCKGEIDDEDAVMLVDLFCGEML